MPQLTKQQQAAYESPYHDDEGAVAPEHTTVHELADGHTISSVLTVERSAHAFGGRPAWHTSAALRGIKNPMPLHRVTEVQLSAISLVARALLAGVGAGEDVWVAGRVALHLRRALSDEELAGLDSSWHSPD